MQAVKELRIFKLRPMSAVLHHYEFASPDKACKFLSFAHRRRRVMRCPEYKRGHRDPGVLLSSKHVSTTNRHFLEAKYTSRDLGKIRLRIDSQPRINQIIMHRRLVKHQ